MNSYSHSYTTESVYTDFVQLQDCTCMFWGGAETNAISQRSKSNELLQNWSRYVCLVSVCVNVRLNLKDFWLKARVA